MLLRLLRVAILIMGVRAALLSIRIVISLSFLVVICHQRAADERGLNELTAVLAITAIILIIILVGRLDSLPACAYTGCARTHRA